MSDDPLRHIGRDGVVKYAAVTPDVRPTGSTEHVLPSGVAGPASTLVIWHDRDDTGGYFLFGLDADAQVERPTRGICRSTKQLRRRAGSTKASFGSTCRRSDYRQDRRMPWTLGGFLEHRDGVTAPSPFLSPLVEADAAVETGS